MSIKNLYFDISIFLMMYKKFYLLQVKGRDDENVEDEPRNTEEMETTGDDKHDEERGKFIIERKNPP